ncbi:MAG: phosphate acyltransferase, partial [Shewanella sp.]
PEYLIPRPFDPRLLISLAPAVAQAAMLSGVATRPMADINLYREKLSQFVYRTGLLMKPMFERARADMKRVVYAEGEEETVLRAVQTVVDEGLARPILIGRPSVIARRIEKLGLRLKQGVDFELTNLDDDPRFNDYWQHYLQIMERHGVTPSAAKAIVRSRSTVVAALMLKRGEVDAMLCGIVGKYQGKLKHVINIIGIDPNVSCISALSVVISDKGPLFFTETHVQNQPNAEQIAEATLQAAYRMKLFGIVPKVALVCHSNFGSSEAASAKKLREALQLILAKSPRLEVEGEMHVDAALKPEIRERLFPSSRLTGVANLLVMPDLDAANTAYNLTRVMTEGIGIGPVLMGMAQPVHVLTTSATVRRVVNMTAIAAVEAQIRELRGSKAPLK